MWKVKRMNRARIAVLAIALGAGGIAAYLVSGSDERPAPAQPVAQLPTVDVLVAKSEIALGQKVKPEDLQWQTWPQATASGLFIRKNERPNATTEITGSIARSSFIAGEPIREQKLVKADGSGFMAAILPGGMRAVSTEISPESAVGGFILPNDRVDVVLTQRLKDPLHPEIPEIVRSQVLLSNIRVLAIDQAPKEKDGQSTLVGKTVTLELKPEQEGTLASGRQAGTLSLVLRSIADANAVEIDTHIETNGSNINIVRYGVPRTTTVQR
jgi:pilus assembly protein CpaB